MATAVTCATSGILYGVIAAVIYVPCIMSCTYRSKLRSKYGLIESPAPDWVVHCLFEWCALCQEYRELQARGLDPSIGKLLLPPLLLLLLLLSLFFQDVF
ncbi:PLAC8 motif-containing protein [Dillenia turbinata]|uniref:PLAC8 motif-containing protein n=1 Tax=Dillenia turbinata TaxID=194707 RepID=A0AAN8Z9A1_9MAGN